MTVISLLAFFAIGTCCCGGCAVTFGGLPGTSFALIVQTCNRIGIIIFLSMTMNFSSDVIKTSEGNIEKLENLEYADCSDQYSRIEITDAINSQESVIEQVKDARKWLYAIIAFLCLEACCPCAVICCAAAARGERPQFCRCTGECSLSDIFKEAAAYVKLIKVFG